MRLLNYIAPIAAFLGIQNAFAATTVDPDTIMVVNNPSQIIITESASGVNLSVRGTDDDPAFFTTMTTDYRPNAVVKTIQRFTPPPFITFNGNSDDSQLNALDLLSGLHAGFCTSLGAPAGLDIEMGKSYEIGIDEIISYRLTSVKAKSHLSIALGVNWRNYRMTANTRFIVDDAGNTTFGQFPDDCQSRYSRIKVFSLTVPLTWYQSTRIKALKTTLGFKVGAILNWNSHASVVSCWDDPDGQTIKQGTKHIGQRTFTVDVLAAVKFAPSIGLYVKYSPMKLFKNNQGPDFTTLSTGIYLGF